MNYLGEKFLIKIECPHCETEQNHFLGAGKQIVTCDSVDHSGCDKDFAVDVRVKIQRDVTTYKLEEVK